jgi:hypothetical protein
MSQINYALMSDQEQMKLIDERMRSRFGDPKKPLN